MSQVTGPLSINNGAATPVAVSFAPESITPERSTFVSRTAGVAAGFLRLLTGLSMATSKRPTYRVNVDFDYPVTSVVNGVATVAYVGRFRGYFVIPEQMTQDERNNLHAFVANALGLPLIRDQVRSLDPLYRGQRRMDSGYGFRAAKHEARVFQLEVRATLRLLESFNTPRSLCVALLIKNGEWQQLLDLTCDPAHYLERDVDRFAVDYQSTAMLQKNPRLPTSTDLKQVAIQKWLQTERLCAETNSRWKDFGNFCLSDLQLVQKIQSIIQRILGPFPSRTDLGFAESSMRFGPGATTSLSGVVTQGSKFSLRRVDTTHGLVGFRAFCFPLLWRENVRELNLVRGSRLTTVPKNAKTDRVICIEPDLNIFVQLGVGALLRKKLRNFGLDLNTQAKNQEFARRAHRDSLCTVDLSSASDTISEEVVRKLLPPAWVELLEYSRCSSTLVGEEWVDLQKWSSMGNGYTFELETLLFYATALAVTEMCDWSDVTVFGDDIVVPSRCFGPLSSALLLLGFKVNTEKTFATGLFYESCGTDFFNGVNVRPFYLRSTIHDFPSVCYLYANNARRWANRRNGGYTCDSRCLPFWLCCFTAVEPRLRHPIPDGVGDEGFVSDFSRYKPPSAAPFGDGWGGHWFVSRRISAVERVIDQMGCYLAFLSGRRSDFSLGREALRGRYRPAVNKLSHSPEWPDLGPWL